MFEPSHQFYDILIVGGGPVGLFLSRLLGGARPRVLVLERSIKLPPFSRAIGITPPSLFILHQLGMDRTFIEQGVRIYETRIYGSRRPIARVNLRGLPKPHNFILSIPQTRTLSILESGLDRAPNVELKKGCNLERIEVQHPQGVTINYRSADGSRHIANARLVIGCDGDKSSVRSAAKCAFPIRRQAGYFVMGDCVDHLQLGAEARLYFTAKGAIESFPLPQNRRRWIAQIDHTEKTDGEILLTRCIHERTGFRLEPQQFTGISTFGLKSALTDRYFAGNLILCGDACHVMSPIGGQGMNIGFSDAYGLSRILLQDTNRQQLFRALNAWQQQRKQAARSAIRRAFINGWIGTRTGTIQSALRNLGIQIALNRWTEAHIANHFAMWTIPYNNFRQTG